MLFHIHPSSRHWPCNAFDGKESPGPTYVLLQISNWECSIKRCYHDSFIDALKGVAFEWFMKLLLLSQEMGRSREAFLGTILLRRYQSIHANSPHCKAEKRRVHQDFYEEILEYGTLISKRHDPIYIDWDLLSQSVNNTPSSNGCSWMTYLEAASLTRRKDRRNHCKSQGWRKRK